MEAIQRDRYSNRSHTTEGERRTNASRSFAGGLKVDKAIVALADQAWDVIDAKLSGKLGSGHSDVIRATVLAYLSEKGAVLLWNSIKRFVQPS